jgi:hypothetical protein
MPISTDDVMAALPKGVIFPWTSKTAPPKGWAVCDGKNGTPNLDGRFLWGTANAGSVGNTGGAASHDHGHVVMKAGGGDGRGFIRISAAIW